MPLGNALPRRPRIRRSWLAAAAIASVFAVASPASAARYPQQQPRPPSARRHRRSPAPTAKGERNR
ncbi:MAG: hypothetical protein MUE49_13815 [Rhodospirillales bacterium]|nr:hypothetical protein [Rhodospirillales bacterium]